MVSKTDLLNEIQILKEVLFYRKHVFDRKQIFLFADFRNCSSKVHHFYKNNFFKKSVRRTETTLI